MKSKTLFLLLLFAFFILYVTFVWRTNNIENFNPQYKKEIEQLIDAQVPLSKKNIDKIFQDVENEKNPYVKQIIIEYGMDTVVLEFYISLIDTTDKYFNIKKDIPPTDWYGTLQKIIDPYLKENNVNASKINSLLKYANKKQKILNARYKP